MRKTSTKKVVSIISVAAMAVPAISIPAYATPISVFDINSSVTDGKVTFDWTKPDYGNFARVAFKRADGSVAYEGTGITFRDDSPIEEEGYYVYTVESIDNNNIVYNSETYPVRVPEQADVTAPNQVDNLSVTTTTYSVYFKWNNPLDADFAGVNVYRGEKKIATVTSDTYFEDQNLASGFTFHYGFSSFDNVGNESEQVPYTVTTDMPDSYLSEVAGVTASADRTSVTLVIAPNNDPLIVKYKVYRDGVYVGYTNSSGPYVDNGLLPGTIHNYRVTAVLADNNETYGKGVNVTTQLPLDQVAPAAITNLQVNRTPYSVSFSWINPTDADFAGIKIYKDGVYKTTTVNPSYFEENLPLDVAITYTFVAVDQSGNESEAVEKTVTLDSVPPAVVTEIKASVNDGKKVVINWTNPSDADFDHVEIYRDEVKLENVTDSTYMDENIQDNSTYIYSLVSVDQSGNSSDAVPFTVTTPDITAPANVTDATYSATYYSVTLNWTNPADEDFDHANVYNSDVLVGTSTGGAPTFTQNGLTASTKQYYRITSVDRSGNESAGEMVEALTEAMPTSRGNNHHSSGGGGGSTAPTTPADGGNTSNPAADAKPVDSTKTTVDGETVLTISDPISGSVKVTVDAESAASGFTVTTKSMNVVVSGNPNVASVVIGSTSQDVAPSNNYKTGSDVVSVTLLDKDGNVVPGTVSIEIPTSLGTELLGNVYEVQSDGSLKIVDSKTSPEFGKVIPDAAQGTKYVVATYTKQFGDVANHWSSADVNFLTSKEIVDGYETGDFKPEGTVTRAEFATMAMKALSYDLGYDVKAPVSDVSTNDWFAGAVSKGFENGIFNGDGSGFSPNQQITKEQMIAILVRIAEKQNGEIKASGDSDKFGDKGQISDWAVDTMDKAAAAGIVTGDDAGDLNPQKTGTRGEAATMISRLFKLINILKKQ